MKKNVAFILALLLVISAGLSACSGDGKKTNGTTTTAPEGLNDAQTHYGFELNEDGEEVAVIYEKDKKGNEKAYEIDSEGNKKKDKKGNYIEIPIKEASTTTTTTKRNDGANSTTTTKNNNSGNTTTTKPSTTGYVPNDDVATTGGELTTLSISEDKVPKLSAAGKEVAFSAEDQQKIANMLEVPGLCNYGYENSDGVSAELAVHVAIWMATRDGQTSIIQPSRTVALDLFKFFGQTVISFSKNCNSAAAKENAPISYSESEDVYNITSTEAKKQTVVIKKIENLGNNNYYKITGNVSGVKGTSKVTAVIQKNRLDNALGFSIKALKWS